jgi:UDP-N-acetylglucosamine diphosphorylase / glucose-1-phosphate thymidylyltransferase / UDP-N-acetylgalactosamine diphosphorylase / glucosamine-1-phosphate N-acetyltransferase / galactosamine-1-phosphate N-acetyltransferase
VNIVMPMAGRGSRFADVGQKLPKPLIPVRGRPMYAWAMDSLPLSLARRVIFICLDEHLRDTPLADDIRNRYANLNPVIVALDHVTEGQACTVLEARDHLVADEALVIYNADTYCRTNLDRRLATGGERVDGIISVFDAPGDKWSFARTDEKGRVLETAEKRRISNWATTGLYHFSKAGDFVTHADAMIAANERERGEFYVAPVYNRLINAGGKVIIDVANEVWVLGTPEDLADFEQRYPRTV